MQNTSSRRLTAEVTHIPGTGWNGLRVFDPLGGTGGMLGRSDRGRNQTAETGSGYGTYGGCLDSFTGSDRRSAGLKEKFS